MKQLFNKLFCLHKWNTFRTSEHYLTSTDELPYKVKHILICEKCGKIKTVIM